MALIQILNGQITLTQDGILPSGVLISVKYNGMEMWYKDGKLHRDSDRYTGNDYPAVIDSNKTKMWYQNGVLYKKDGPAVVYPDGKEEWYDKDGKCLSENEAKIASENAYWKMMCVGWNDGCDECNEDELEN